MLERIFKRSKKTEGDAVQPAIEFGRYSDNNKPVYKADKWSAAEAFFKEKKYRESLSAFFEYVSDDRASNVVHEPTENGGGFYLYQGSKIIRGLYNAEGLQAEALLASMPQPNVPVMRRLLEINFNLYYSRYALKDNKLYMLFNTGMETASPGKLYYALKELAVKADKQGLLLVQDFTALQPEDTEHIQPLPQEEKEVKYAYFKKWIQETLTLIAGVDADNFSGGISYLLLALAFRIDFLITPNGKLGEELEKIIHLYFKKDNRAITEKNSDMIDSFGQMQTKTKAEVFPYLFRSRYTFPVNNPQKYKTISDAISNANQNISWYKENNHHAIAARISEYGLSYCQYSYSLPKPITELYLLLLMINYPGYFKDLGFSEAYYNEDAMVFHKEKITARIETIQQGWKEKYPELNFKTGKLLFDNLMLFNQSFTTEVEGLNLEIK